MRTFLHRTIFVTCSVLASGSLACASAQNPAQNARGSALPPGARIGVVVLDGSGGNQVDRVVGDMLTTALRRAGIRVIERQAIDQVVKEQNLVRSGVVDPATAAPAGKVLGVDYLLGVKATEFGVKDDRVGAGVALGPVAGVQIRTSTARVVLDSRLIDTTTGTVVITSTAEGKQVHHGGTLLAGVISGRMINLGGIDIGSKDWSESSLGKAARKAVEALVKKMALSIEAGDGLVLAAVPTGDLIVGLGGFDGVRKGDELEVIRLETIRDSSGKIVWSDERIIGRARVADVRGDRAKVRVESREEAKEGDLVRLTKRSSKATPSRQDPTDDPSR